MIGMFAVSEIIRYVVSLETEATIVDQPIGNVFKGMWGLAVKYPKQILRGSTLGTLIGALPGAGADIAAWMSYAMSKRLSKEPEKFGTGHVEGIVESGSANNSALAGAWIPALVFGIPGDSITAIVIGVLYMKNMNPGPTLFTTNPQNIYAVFLLFIIANLIMLPLGWMCIKAAKRILKVPREVLMPVILLFCIVGSFAINNTGFDIGHHADRRGRRLCARGQRLPDHAADPRVVLGAMLEDNFVSSMIKSTATCSRSSVVRSQAPSASDAADLVRAAGARLASPRAGQDAPSQRPEPRRCGIGALQPGGDSHRNRSGGALRRLEAARLSDENRKPAAIAPEARHERSHRTRPNDSRPRRQGLRRRMADPGRPRRGVPAGRAVQVGRPRLHAHHRAHSRHRALPNQSVRLMFEEITASSLVKIDLQGNVLQETPFPINPAGFTIHSAVHAARHDILCVMHTHTLNGVAVAAQKRGLLPISQQSIFVLSSLAYHDYEGVALRDDEKPRLVANFGDKTYLMLRNHGLLTVGRTIADAFQAMYIFEASCAIQVRAQAGGTLASGDLIEVHGDIIRDAGEQARLVSRGAGSSLTWPGLLRRLERSDPSYRT
jgi:ribulose-5-phosphate 4-epimerase/fuculose-1-phosphate aldolase